MAKAKHFFQRGPKFASCENVDIDTVLVTLLTTLLIASFAYLLWYNCKKGVICSVENYSNSQDKLVLYFFLMHGCGWCDKLKPHLTSLQQTVASDPKLNSKIDITVVQVPTDVADERDALKEFAVNAFPTIVLSKKDHSKYWTYHSSQERTSESILQWVSETLAAQ
jgi:thiol-disulfide isomerase/thioredoxin